MPNTNAVTAKPMLRNVLNSGHAAIDRIATMQLASGAQVKLRVVVSTGLADIWFSAFFILTSVGLLKWTMTLYLTVKAPIPAAH